MCSELYIANENFLRLSGVQNENEVVRNEINAKRRCKKIELSFAQQRREKLKT